MTRQERAIDSDGETGATGASDPDHRRAARLFDSLADGLAGADADAARALGRAFADRLRSAEPDGSQRSADEAP